MSRLVELQPPTLIGASLSRDGISPSPSSTFSMPFSLSALPSSSGNSHFHFFNFSVFPDLLVLHFHLRNPKVSLLHFQAPKMVLKFQHFEPKDPTHVGMDLVSCVEVCRKIEFIKFECFSFLYLNAHKAIHDKPTDPHEHP